MGNQYDFAVYRFVVDMVSEMTVEREQKIQVDTVEMVFGSVVWNAQNIGALVNMVVVVVVVAAAVVVVVAVDVVVVVVVVAAAVVVVAVADVIVEADKKVETEKKLSNS